MKRLLFLMLLNLPFTTFAHDMGGELGEPASATDYYMIYCSTDGTEIPDKLYFQLTSTSPSNAPLISAQIAKDTFATSVTDLINGDANSSRVAEIIGGEGAYRVTVNKNKVGKASYAFVYHCESNNGEHTETTDTTLQSQ